MIALPFRRWKHARRERRALAEIAARAEDSGRPHGLHAPLVVSLTSYPARFGSLGPTLRSLLRQTVRPDRVILWLDPGDEARLPDEITALEGLELRTSPEWRSYKKLVPALLEAPDAFIVTADDDVYYPPNWLERLAAGAKASGVTCLRAHKVVMAGGEPAAYELWQHNINAPAAGPLVFPTGVSGVVYAPGVFHPDVARPELFMELAAGADDVWLYWMHRLTGSCPMKIGGRARILEWTGSQLTNLRAVNRPAQGHGGNDRAVAAMIKRYGWPA